MFSQIVSMAWSLAAPPAVSTAVFYREARRVDRSRAEKSFPNVHRRPPVWLARRPARARDGLSTRTDAVLGTGG